MLFLLSPPRAWAWSLDIDADGLTHMCCCISSPNDRVRFCVFNLYARWSWYVSMSHTYTHDTLTTEIFMGLITLFRNKVICLNIVCLTSSGKHFMHVQDENCEYKLLFYTFVSKRFIFVFSKYMLLFIIMFFLIKAIKNTDILVLIKFKSKRLRPKIMLWQLQLNLDNQEKNCPSPYFS